MDRVEVSINWYIMLLVILLESVGKIGSESASKLLLEIKATICNNCIN